MNDEELKGMVVNNTAVPLQDGVSLDSLFQSSNKDTSGENVSSSLASLGDVDSGNYPSPKEVSSFENSNVSSDEATIDSVFHNLGLDNKKEENIVQEPAIMEEPNISIPQVTIENLNQEDFVAPMEVNNIDSFSSQENFVQNSNVEDSAGGVTELPVSISNFETPLANEQPMQYTASLEATEIPQVTIEDPNRNNVLENSMDATSMPNVPIYEQQMEVPNAYVEIPSENAGAVYVENVEIPQPMMDNVSQNDVNTMGVNDAFVPFNSVENSNESNIPTNSFGSVVAPVETGMLLDEAFQVPTETGIPLENQDTIPSMNIGEVVPNVDVPMQPVYESIPNMSANPNAEPASIHLSDDISDSGDYEAESNYIIAEEISKTEADLDLERRNRSGVRFIIILGLLLLIFIILLPFISEYI